MRVGVVFSQADSGTDPAEQLEAVLVAKPELDRIVG
jgi:hypothetical protein